MPGTNKIAMFVAFDQDTHGSAVPAFEPRQAESEEEAIRSADMLASMHAGAIAWRRDSRPAIGEIGEPVILFQRGRIGDFN
jgi:hypothetical protein